MALLASDLHTFQGCLGFHQRPHMCESQAPVRLSFLPHASPLQWAMQVAEAKAQLEGELQAAQQQRGSGGGRGSGGAAAVDAAAAQLSPRVPSPQEDAR